MKLRSTTTVAGAAALAGALLASLFDPERGRTRRTRMTGRTAGTLRRTVRTTRRAARRRGAYVSGKAVGTLHGLRADSPPENDQTLADKVRSEVLGRERWRHRAINVSAAHGVVQLNGQLDRPEDIEDLLREVSKVTGVQAVENGLHLPGTPAPTKRASMTTTAT